MPEFRVNKIRGEDLIIPESMPQDFGFTVMLEIQAHSWLRNCFFSTAVESKGKLDSGIIEFSFLSQFDKYLLSSHKSMTE